MEVKYTNRYTIDITYKIRHFEDIANLRPFKNLKKPLWEDAASAGYSFSWSSKIGRLNADLTLKCITRKFEIDGNYSIIVTQPIPAGPGTTKMVASPGTIA
ncbi:hypothetical protein D3H65_01160 [Paraflavitalea soli]|uniref:Uncharacterized protein n=1 Tax=Paraflavitalea soli TaxID=2315862 RepID=A0A3B7MHU0_9BACT|nr:hypothetical protein [Paraflavitalea soli]AXY72666.1 hypothetical protein D3H65_01160 [Paraflavitalea soli]